MKTRRGTTALLALNTILFLGAANWIILDREDLRTHGRPVLLEIGCYDPRSLMQGDYMALRYAICGDIQQQLPQDARGEGLVVAGIDADGVGHFRRLHTGGQLTADECLLRYKIRWGHRNRVRVAAESFFFSEGEGAEYERARYAELRIDAAGRTLLVTLCDADRARLGPPE